MADLFGGPLSPSFCRLGYDGVRGRCLLKADARETLFSGFSIE